VSADKIGTLQAGVLCDCHSFLTSSCGTWSVKPLALCLARTGAGSFASATCLNCKKAYTTEDLRERILKGEVDPQRLSRRAS
jgi:hypothetical protein